MCIAGQEVMHIVDEVVYLGRHLVIDGCTTKGLRSQVLRLDKR